VGIKSPEEETPDGWISRRLEETKGKSSSDGKWPLVTLTMKEDGIITAGQKLRIETLQPMVGSAWTNVLGQTEAIGFEPAAVSELPFAIADDMNDRKPGEYTITLEGNAGMH
jgi:hypothetical protein